MIVDGDGKEKRPVKDVILSPPSPKVRAAISRRVIEISLAVGLAAMVLLGGDRRSWKEVKGRKRGMGPFLVALLASEEAITDEFYTEVLPWMTACTVAIASYPVRIWIRKGLRPPKSLDPSPILYPLLYPVLVALSVGSKNTAGRNRFLLANLVLSLSNLPPVLMESWNLQWLLSLAPLVSFLGGRTITLELDEMTLIPPMNALLTSALTTLLHPSLTLSELRLLSSALINLLWHAQSPQALVLRAMIWGGGISVYFLCEDLIRWNISLARVPTHKFRTAGNAVIGIGRLRKLAALRKWKSVHQASDSEASDVDLIKPGLKRPRARSFFTSLSEKQARRRKWGYSLAVHGVVFMIVMAGLRPYIASAALGGVDPFIWAPSYVLCGQLWYQNLMDKWVLGMGYCVTEGSFEAANVRFGLVCFWAFVLTVGLTIVGIIAPNIEVDTRRKVFHGMALIMFLVPGMIDPVFTYLALSVALALFILFDLIRAGQLPPLSTYIARFLAPYVDGRDLKGPMVISHVFLLIGSGIGWWLTLAGIDQRDWEWNSELELSFVAGVACVGLGDAAASLIGRRFGRTKWGWRGGKSVEGSLAFAVAVAAGLCVGRSYIVGWKIEHWGMIFWGKLALTAVWGSMVEAVATGVNDNVVVPLGIWMVVRALGL